MSCNCPFKSPDLEDMKKLDRYNWNVTLGKEHKPMQVYRIDGCIHTKGGKRGTNELYVADRAIAKEDIKPSDLTPFSGDICWGINIQQKNYFRKDEVRVGCGADITCGGRKIYHITCSFEYIAAKAMDTLLKLQEDCPIPFGEIDFEKWVIRRKIFWRDQPAVITSYNVEDGTVFIKPIGRDTFKLLNRDKQRKDGIKEYTRFTSIKDDILTDSIWWFRDECVDDIIEDMSNTVIVGLTLLKKKVTEVTLKPLFNPGKIAQCSNLALYLKYEDGKCVLYDTAIPLEEISVKNVDVNKLISEITKKLIYLE